MAKSKSKAKKVNTAPEAVNVEKTEEKKPQASRKQIRDAAKKKARTKKRVITVIISAVAAILAVALIAVGMFFSLYDPVGDNIEATITAIFTMPYEKSGSDDLKSDSPMFPLDQAAYFYFYNNYSDIMTEDCCMEIKNNVKYWNVWNKQTEYTIEVNDFAYADSTGDTGIYEVMLDIKNGEGEVVDTVVMMGSFAYDAETKLISNLRFEYEDLIELGNVYNEHVLGQVNETTDEETAE